MRMHSFFHSFVLCRGAVCQQRGLYSWPWGQGPVGCTRQLPWWLRKKGGVLDKVNQVEGIGFRIILLFLSLLLLLFSNFLKKCLYYIFMQQVQRKSYLTTPMQKNLKVFLQHLLLLITNEGKIQALTQSACDNGHTVAAQQRHIEWTVWHINSLAWVK